jgi:hypothetical protein
LTPSQGLVLSRRRCHSVTSAPSQGLVLAPAAFVTSSHPHRPRDSFSLPLLLSQRHIGTVPGTRSRSLLFCHSVTSAPSQGLVLAPAAFVTASYQHCPRDSLLLPPLLSQRHIGTVPGTCSRSRCFCHSVTSAPSQGLVLAPAALVTTSHRHRPRDSFSLPPLLSQRHIRPVPGSRSLPPLLSQRHIVHIPGSHSLPPLLPQRHIGTYQNRVLSRRFHHSVTFFKNLNLCLFHYLFLYVV